MERFPEPRTRPGAVLTILAVAALAAAAAAILAISGEDIFAGVAVATSGTALVLGDLRARKRHLPRLVFASSIVERAIDGAVFGALAWALMPAAPRAGAAALAALSTSYVATYIRVKATGLGFDVQEPLLMQPLRMASVAIGLLAGGVEAGLWGAVAVGAAGMVARGRQVAVRRETA